MPSKSENNKKPSKKPTNGGGGTGGNGIPKTTIEKAIEEIKTKVSDNKDNILFLRSYEPTVQSQVTNGYIERGLWNQLDDPIYNDLDL